MIKEVNKENFETEVLKEDMVVVDFYANWCGPCKMLRPVLEEVAKDGTGKIVSVNVDDEKDLAIEYGISSIPCLVLFKGGKETRRNVGFIPKEKVEEMFR